jgi:hypothetical protein
LWECDTLKREPLHRKKLRPDPEKFTDLRASRRDFTAIIRNFAAGIAHIRQGLSSEQFCGPERREETAKTDAIIASPRVDASVIRFASSRGNDLPRRCGAAGFSSFSMPRPLRRIRNGIIV